MNNRFKNIIYKFLKISQKFTETDNVYLAKYGSYLTMGNIISTIATILLSLAFANLLPKEIYGEYRYILSIVSLLAITSLQGIDKAVGQAVANGFDGTFIKGIKTKLKWSLIGSLISIGFATHFWINQNAELTISFFIIAIFLPSFKAGELFKFYLDGKKLFGLRMAYFIIIQILSSIFITITLFFTNNLAILILVYFLSYSTLRTFFTFVSIKKIKPNKIFNSKFTKYGKHSSLMAITGIIANQIDKVLLFHFVGAAQLAVYSFAFLPIQYIRTPLQQIQELALPKLSTKSNEEIKKTLPKKLLKATILILLIIGLYIVIAPFFYKIVYPQYVGSIPYTQLLAFTLLSFPASMMSLSLQAKMETKKLYISAIISPIVKICLLIILIPIYGILGLIISLLLFQIFSFFFIYILFKRM